MWRNILKFLLVVNHSRKSNHFYNQLTNLNSKDEKKVIFSTASLDGLLIKYAQIKTYERRRSTVRDKKRRKKKRKNAKTQRAKRGPERKIEYWEGTEKCERGASRLKFVSVAYLGQGYTVCIYIYI